MANLTVRRDGGQLAQPAEWEPFRIMRELARWDPFREMMPALFAEPAGFYPAFDIKETKDAFLFRADMPGVKQADLDITVEGNRLQVSGKRETDRQEKTDTYYAYERSYGSFARTFTLPQNADPKAVRADLTEGVLTITLGKTPESQATRVQVQAGAAKPKS